MRGSSDHQPVLCDLECLSRIRAHVAGLIGMRTSEPLEPMHLPTARTLLPTRFSHCGLTTDVLRTRDAVLKRVCDRHVLRPRACSEHGADPTRFSRVPASTFRSFRRHKRHRYAFSERGGTQETAVAANDRIEGRNDPRVRRFGEAHNQRAALRDRSLRKEKRRATQRLRRGQSR